MALSTQHSAWGRTVDADGRFRSDGGIGDELDVEFGGREGLDGRRRHAGAAGEGLGRDVHVRRRRRLGDGGCRSCRRVPVSAVQVPTVSMRRRVGTVCMHVVQTAADGWRGCRVEGGGMHVCTWQRYVPV